MIQLTTKGMTGIADTKALADEFASKQCVRIPQLLSIDLGRIVSTHVDRGGWIHLEHRNIGQELFLDNLVALNALHFAVNTPRFHEFVEIITGCEPIVRFEGRVYRMTPGAGHHDSWHNDNFGGRLVGMSIHLGKYPHNGGIFQLRDAESKKKLCDLPNTILGDAIMFRISPRLEHRVTDVEGGEPKTAFAGWFKNSGTDYFSSIRNRSADRLSLP